MTDIRVYSLDGVRNFRDFGNYPSRFGGHVQAGRLFRSGHYAEATDDDLAEISALDIHVQVDLRRPDERERLPGKWTATRVISHDDGRETQAPHEWFLKRVEGGAEAAEAWMTDYYRAAPFKKHHTDMFGEWFTALGTLPSGSAALVNCAAGKDRTGILCALTHHVLGVSPEDIRADYKLTNQAADVATRLPIAAAFYNDMLGKDHPEDVYRPFLGVRLAFLKAAIDSINDQAGSVDDYLTDVLGVDEPARDKIRDGLLTG
ncbi:MAG: tyrosine-protein phosphatase [Hyphomonas sp.]